MPTQSEFYKEVYFPHQRYLTAYEYALEEIEGEVERQAALDDLILKSQANTSRLADVHRERAVSPGQQIRLTESRRLMRDYELEIAKQAASQAGFANNPGSRGIEAVRVFRESTGAPPDEVAREAVIIATREAGKISNEALKRKAFVDIMESAGPDYKADAEIALNRAVRATFDDAYINVVTKAGSQEDAAARAAASGFAAPEVPIAIMRAQAEVSSAESPFAHGKMVPGLTPEEEELRNLFVNRLRDEGSPGTATVDEFESPEQYAQAKLAYETAREEGAYLKSDAEWFAFDYLSAVQTEGELKRRRDEGLDYADPFLEAQRRARERGGYTQEDLYELKYYNTPKADRVRPAFARARAEDGIDAKTDMESVVGSLYEQSKSAGTMLTDEQLVDLLKDKQRSERKVSSRNRQAERKAGGDRQDRQEFYSGERKDRQGFYSNEAIELGMIYLSARKIYDQGLVDRPAEEIVAPIDPAIPTAGDDLAEAAVNREMALRQVQDEVAAKETLLIPEEVKETLVIPEEDLLAGIDLSQSGPPALVEGETIVETPQAPAPVQAPAPAPVPAPVLAVGDVGYEFTDKGDGSRYRRTEDGFVALSGQYAGRKFPASSASARALMLAEQEDYAGVAALQRQRAPVVQAPEPVQAPASPLPVIRSAEDLRLEAEVDAAAKAAILAAMSDEELAAEIERLKGE